LSYGAGVVVSYEAEPSGQAGAGSVVVGGVEAEGCS
jgi:hypothetical protein